MQGVDKYVNRLRLRSDLILAGARVADAKEGDRVGPRNRDAGRVAAIFSHAVSRRTREIGVRVALGGRPLQVAGSVLSRAVRQVAYGVLAGGAVIPLGLVAVSRLVEPGPDLPPVPWMAVLLLAYMSVMMGACMLACVVPLRRALRVEPTEALAAEG